MAVKSLLKSQIVRRALCWLGSAYIRFMHATNRWTTEGEAFPEQFWSEGKPFIVAFWHGRLVMMPYGWRRGLPFFMLISGHQDGELIANIVSYFGIETIKGSRSKGGSAAFREMLKTLKRGGHVGITPDGPRGPRMRASDGIITVAKVSGCPIIPLGFSTSKGQTMRSWDSLLMPYSFGRGIFIWGEPIFVDKDADASTIESKRLEVETALNEITQRADEYVGRPVVKPADPDVG